MRSELRRKITDPMPLRYGLVASNRLHFASIGFDLCDEQGFPTDEFFETYKRLMDGGCGFGFLGNANVEDRTQYNDRGLKLVSQAHGRALAPLLELASRKQFPLGIQLQSYGPQGVPSSPNGILFSPSGQPHSTPRVNAPFRMVAMSEAQIADCINEFATSAKYAVNAGATIIQLQAANGYLLSSFLSPETNRRTDAWGGTPLKRAKLLLEIIERIRVVTADRVNLTIRLGIDDGLEEGGLKPEMLGEVVGALEQSSVVAITCALGTNKTIRKLMNDHDRAISMCRAGARHLKRFCSIPVGMTGSVWDVETADELVGAGDVDFVGLGRAVVADNDIVAKELGGRKDFVSRCRGDAFCFRDKKDARARRVFCCVNPNYLRPSELQKIYEDSSR